MLGPASCFGLHYGNEEIWSSKWQASKGGPAVAMNSMPGRGWNSILRRRMARLQAPRHTCPVAPTCPTPPDGVYATEYSGKIENYIENCSIICLWCGDKNTISLMTGNSQVFCVLITLNFASEVNLKTLKKISISNNKIMNNIICINLSHFKILKTFA